MTDRVADFLSREADDARANYNIFAEMFNERSQMYGTLIQLMVLLDVKELTLDYDKIRSSKKYTLNFIPNNDSKQMKLELVDNVEKEIEG